jgi:glutathione S-transferase
MPHSNNCSRISIWLTLRGLPPGAVISKTVTMEDLRSDAFAAVNPLMKVPAAIDADVGLYKLKSQLETAWFEPSSVISENSVSKFAFTCNLYRYTEGNSLFEASVILTYLEDKFHSWVQQQQGRGVANDAAAANDGASSTAPHRTAVVAGGGGFRPETPERRAAVDKLVRVHDLYIASANCTQFGFTHTQGAMYLAPRADKFTPARRGRA